MYQNNVEVKKCAPQKPKNDVEILREYSIGIDLGTTYSSIAVYLDGRPEVIPDRSGDRLIPSIVFFDPQSGKPTVGKSAIDLAVKCPANCLKDAKRIIGRRFDDDYISRICNLKTTDFTLARWNNDSTVYQLTIGGRKSFKTPEEVIAHILVYLKQMASEYLGTKVKEVVVSIPAHFSISQRMAIKKAIDLAGLILQKFISETSAGAVHYIKDTSKISKILVFDWGGGKIDVSSILLKDRTFEVKAVAGNTLVGGTDIDERLFKFYNRCFSSRIKHRLMKGCVNLKHQLSFNQEYCVTIDCYDGLNDLNLDQSRSELDNINKDLIEKVINIIDLCLEDAGWSSASVDELALIGGSTRIPRIREEIKAKFPGVKMRADFNPDEAVAAGACLAAFWNRNSSQSNCKIIDVTPLSLGLESYGRLFDVFITRNSSLPVMKSKRFCTSENYQENVNFKIFEGERKNCLYNSKLGELNIYGMPPMRAGEFEFIVTFALDHNGFLTAEASEDSDGETNNLLVKTSHFGLCGSKPYFSLEEARSVRNEDDTFEKFVCIKQILRDKCNRLIYDLHRIKLESDMVIVRESCQHFLEYSEKSSVTSSEDIMSKFQVLDALVLPILRKNNLLRITRYDE